MDCTQLTDNQTSCITIDCSILKQPIAAKTNEKATNYLIFIPIKLRNQSKGNRSIPTTITAHSQSKHSIPMRTNHRAAIM